MSPAQHPAEEMSNVRQRVKPRPPEDPLSDWEWKDGKHKGFFYVFPAQAFLTGCLALAMLYVSASDTEHKLPKPLKKVDESLYPQSFIAERAKNHVHNITSLGPRPVGSFANEVLAVSFLLKEIDFVIKKANPIHRVQTDVQKTSGSFQLQFLDGMTSVYENIQNIIVKIGPSRPATHSVLFNCHYDTVADSPGGSDNSASCAVLLEIFRIVSESSVGLKNNIIFLFNGAEENLLQGSHAFITQHKWASEIKAFVNLEACGAGGRELLFQSGPENPWLIELYAKSVPYPLASSLAQEIFESGVIPGETDFRIFRDFGNIPGLDFAWAVNGYVYHTKLDNAENVPIASLQRTGDNLLALAKSLAHYDFPVKNGVKGNCVFFDVFGLFLVNLNQNVALLVCFMILAFAAYQLFFSFRRATAEGVRKHEYIFEVIKNVIIIFVSWILAEGYIMFVSLFLPMVNRALSWYSRPVWLLYLYVTPSLLIPLALATYRTTRSGNSAILDWKQFCFHTDANAVVWMLGTLTCLIFRVRSGFIPAIWLCFSSFANLARDISFPRIKSITLVVIYLTILILPFCLSSYIINGALLIIVPIMGRAGSGNRAETVMAGISSVMFILLFMFLVPLIYLVKDKRKVLAFFFTVHSVALLVLLFTPYGFPYSSDSSQPSHQRYMILHVERLFHDRSGKIEDSAFGFWSVDLDVNSPRSVSALVPEMSLATPVKDCDRRLYCGLPYIIPVLKLMWRTHWIDGPRPLISVKTSLVLTDKVALSNTTVRLFFSAVGPDHMSIMVSPFLNVKLINWSVEKNVPLEGPSWGSRKTYFIYYSCASNPEPWNFSMDFEVPPSHDDYLIDIALGGHFLHGAHQRSVKLKKLLSQFPPWSVTSGWTATYKSYIF